MKPIIAPSILSADFGYLAKDIEMVNRSEAEWVHIDIMDGVFVPNISFGFPVLKYVAKLSQKPLDVHLMIVNPEKFIPEVKALGAHTMNVHYEVCPHLHRVIQQIREAGMQPAGGGTESGETEEPGGEDNPDGPLQMERMNFRWILLRGHRSWQASSC